MTNEKTAINLVAGGRDYITRLRRDPRTKTMHDGWVAQATVEAEQRYPQPLDANQRAHFAATRALALGMSFVLDNDGELNAVRERLERVLENHLELARLTPPVPFITKTGEDE